MDTTQTDRMTAEQFAELDVEGPCELIEGAVHMVTPAAWESGRLGARVARALLNFVEPACLGEVGGADAGFILSRDPDTVRAPDAAFVRADRLAERIEGFFPGPPDLAVEVVSPSDRVHDVEAKAEAWLEAGTRMVWVVWPNTRTVSVHVPGQPVRTYREGEALCGADVIPGFECDVADVFA